MAKIMQTDKLQKLKDQTSGKLQEVLNTREKTVVRLPGLLGKTNTEGSATVPGKPNWCYVRVGGDETRTVAFNNRTPHRNGLPVVVGYDQAQPQLFQVLAVRNVYDDTTPMPGTIGKHRETHEWGNSEGDDIPYIRMRQVNDCRVYARDPATLLVNISDGIYIIGQQVYYYAGGTLDLTSDKPGSGMLYSLIAFDENGPYSVAGASGTTVALSDIPDATKVNDWRVAAVLLKSTTTTITDWPGTIMILDLRLAGARSPSDSGDLADYLLADGTRELTGDWGLGDTYGISEVPFIDFYLAYADGHAEGRLHWNSEDGTLEVGMPGGDVKLQIGQEHMIRCRNETGSTIGNGKVVYMTGTSGNKPLIALAKADDKSTAIIFGTATEDIDHNDNGYVTLTGLVRGMDTSAIAEGGFAFLSDSVAGDLSATPATAPSFKARVGWCIVQHASDGVLYVNAIVALQLQSLSDVETGAASDLDFLRWSTANGVWEYQNDASIDHENLTGAGALFTHAQIEAFLTHFNGTFLESFDALVTSDGATVTMSLEQSGTGDLTMRFSDGFTTLDCTDPLQTIELTAGSDDSPTTNYIYILQSSKVLTKNTSNWPSEEHIKIGFFLVPSAGYVDTNGVYINQNWNDHATGINDQGHMSQMAQRIRIAGAQWFSGVAGNGTSDYLTLAGTTVNLKTTAGIVSQMHPHTFPAFDTSGGDEVLVVNWDGDPYHNITNLYDIVNDSGGSGITTGRYFNLIIWGVANKTGEPEQLMINLPSGSYNTLASAQQDASGYDNFAIPREFSIESSTGFLICRLTLRKLASSWTYHATVDLRGSNPQTATGGAAAIVTEFADNTFRVYDEGDNTKEMALDASGISVSTTRTLAVPDADGEIELTGHASKHDQGGGDALSTVPDHDHSGDAGDGGQTSFEDLSDVDVDLSEWGGSLLLVNDLGTHIVPGALSVIDHGEMGGLEDDDHTQYIKDSEYTAKGDILGGTGVGTFAALPVGGDGEVLVADSLEATGLNWAAAPAPGAHAASHKDGGGDELDVSELAGALGAAGTIPETDGAAVTWVEPDARYSPANHDHTGDAGDGGQLDHGDLAGLTDDDHTIYLLASGAREGASAGAQSFGANGILADQIDEDTPAAGVIVESVWLKDGLIRAGSLPGCKTSRATQEIPNLVDTAFNFSVEEWDDAAFHFGGTNPSRITIPAGYGGRYLIMGYAISVENTNPSRVYYSIKKNGAPMVISKQELEGVSATPKAHTITYAEELAATDYVELFIYQDGGAVDWYGDLTILRIGD